MPLDLVGETGKVGLIHLTTLPENKHFFSFNNRLINILNKCSTKLIILTKKFNIMDNLTMEHRHLEKNSRMTTFEFYEKYSRF